MMRRVMRDVLTSLGVNNVEVVTINELEAPENAQFQPDVIFTDWSPNCDGLDVIKQIQKEILELDLDGRKRMELVAACGEAEFRMTEGSDEFIQLEALLARVALAGSQ